MKKSITKILTLVFALLLTVSVCACGDDKQKNIEDMTDSELANVINSAMGGSDEKGDDSSKGTESEEPEGHKYETATLRFNSVVEETEDDSTESENDGTILGFTVKDYNGEIVYYFKNQSTLTVLSVDNGTVYANSYYNNGKKKDFDNKVVSLYESSTKIDHTSAKNITVIEDDGVATLTAEINGKYYIGAIKSLNYRNPQIYVDELEGATKLWASGTDVYADSAIYTKGTDEACLYMVGTNDRTLTLPNGYTAKDVKAVYLEKLITAVMNDGTVCYIKTEKNGGDYTFTIHEELSKLNKEGHVKEIFFSSYSQGCTGYAHMDDEKIYIIGEVTYR